MGRMGSLTLVSIQQNAASDNIPKPSMVPAFGDFQPTVAPQLPSQSQPIIQIILITPLDRGGGTYFIATKTKTSPATPITLPK